VELHIILLFIRVDHLLDFVVVETKGFCAHCDFVFIVDPHVLLLADAMDFEFAVRLHVLRPFFQRSRGFRHSLK